jgi:hypothetical protein
MRNSPQVAAEMNLSPVANSGGFLRPCRCSLIYFMWQSKLGLSLQLRAKGLGGLGE